MSDLGSHRSLEATERRIALVTIFTPFLAVLALVGAFWGRGVTWLDLILCLVMYSLTMLGITLGYHRLFTHHSFKCVPPLTALLGVSGCMAAQGPILFWTACHRHHHRCSDTEGDPHSPHTFGTGLSAALRGWWHAHCGWMLNHKPENYRRLVPDLIRNPTILRIDRYYFLWIALGLFLPGVIAASLTHTWIGFFRGVLWGGFVRIFLVHHTTWSINSICHLFGSAPFDTHDESRNNIFCAFLTFGEGWHNNHHAFPSSARHGLSWWQFDLTYIILRALAFCGLASDIREPKPEEISMRQKTISNSTNVA